MVTTPGGLIVPAGTDPFDPQGDMVDLANSMRSRLIYPTANATARDSLLAAITWTPSASEPLKVHRGDTGLIECNTAGSTWSTIGGTAQAWTAPAYASNWGNWGSGFQSVQVFRDPWGNVRIRGRVKRTGVTFTGAPGQILTLPSWAGSFGGQGRLLRCGTSNGMVQVQVVGTALSILTSGTWTIDVSSIELDGLSWEGAA
jgi:hypothetical protein